MGVVNRDGRAWTGSASVTCIQENKPHLVQFLLKQPPNLILLGLAVAEQLLCGTQEPSILLLRSQRAPRCSQRMGAQGLSGCHPPPRTYWHHKTGGGGALPCTALSGVSMREVQGPQDRRTQGGGGWGITFSWSSSCCRLALYCGVLVYARNCRY